MCMQEAALVTSSNYNEKTSVFYGSLGWYGTCHTLAQMVSNVFGSFDVGVTKKQSKHQEKIPQKSSVLICHTRVAFNVSPIHFAQPIDK